jgi:hypothetical protein
MPTLADFVSHSLEVDLLSFSLGGGEHPSATQSTLLLKDVSIEDGVEWE